MVLFAVAAVLSFLGVWVLLLTRNLHGALTSDLLEGVQKVHSHQVLRVGGLALFAGLFVALVMFALTSDLTWSVLSYLLGISSAFCLGLWEDVTKRVPPKWRLVGSIFVGLILVSGLGLNFSRTGWGGLDNWLFSHPSAAFLLALFYVTSFVQAYNIIDGLNGLSLLCALLPLVWMGGLSAHFGDSALVALTLLHIGGIAGLLVWNFPFGRIFCGDGGAYLLGASCGALGLYFINRNVASVSPWILAVWFVYPAWELAFSFFRRKIEGHSPLNPDSAHLHSLVFSWVSRRLKTSSNELRHAVSVGVILLMFLPFQLLSLPFYGKTKVMIALFSAEIAVYLLLYFFLRSILSPKKGV